MLLRNVPSIVKTTRDNCSAIGERSRARIQEFNCDYVTNHRRRIRSLMLSNGRRWSSARPFVSIHVTRTTRHSFPVSLVSRPAMSSQMDEGKPRIRIRPSVHFLSIRLQMSSLITLMLVPFNFVISHLRSLHSARRGIRKWHLIDYLKCVLDLKVNAIFIH